MYIYLLINGLVCLGKLTPVKHPGLNEKNYGSSGFDLPFSHIH